MKKLNSFSYSTPRAKSWTDWEINKSSWISETEEDPGQTEAPQDWTDRWKQGVTLSWNRHTSGNYLRNQCWGRKTWTVIDKWLAGDSVWQLWQWKTPGDPDTGPPKWDLPTGAWPGSHSKCKRKIPLGFQQGDWKRNPFKTSQSTLLFLTRPALRGNSLARVQPSGVLTEPGKGYSIPVRSSLSRGRREVPNSSLFQPSFPTWGGRKKQRNTCEVHSPDAQAH